MKRMKLSPLLTSVMATQMILSPVAFAINPLEAINMAGQIIQANQQNMASQQQALANQQLVGQMTQPGRDKYFNTDTLARIPGLVEYMGRNGLNPASLTCPTLPTTVTEIRAEVCRVGLTNDRGVVPQAQLAEMFSLYKTYGDVSKAYESYSSISNAEGQGFGVGCMQNAMQVLNGFFAYRTNELDKLTTNLEALQNQFREASKSDLDAITDSTAVLNGGDTDLTAEARTRRPDLFDFGKRFDNPACKSMFAGDAFNTKGNAGGLNQINKELKAQYSQPSGKYSGESYVTAHATVVDDINKMADKAAQQFQLNFSSIADGKDEGFSNYLARLPSQVSSSTGLKSQLTADFFADAQMTYNKMDTKIEADVSTLKNELGSIADNALSIAKNLNATNFDSEVEMVQTQIRNNCLQRSFSGSGFWDQMKRNIIDPTGSKFANKNEYNPLRQRLEGIMTNPRTTPEEKLAALQTLEKENGNRFVLNMQGSYQKAVIQNGKTVMQSVTPSGSAPSAYFADVVQTCDAQFTTNKLGSTLTGAAAIQKLREINQEYKTLAANESNTIRNEIRRKLIECSNPVEANVSQAGSCTPDRFNTSGPGFCANAAFTCANNMKSCTTQAQTFVNQIKQERSLRVNNYNALVTKNKADIVRIFDTALSKYMKEGEMMRGLFGAGFSSPSGIQRDIPGDAKYIDKFRSYKDDPLLLQDPDKFVAMFKQNINLLKDAVQKQQQEIMGNGGRGGVIAQHIEETKNNYKTAKAKADEIANQCLQKHDQAIAQMEAQRQQQLAEQQKKMNELGEKRQQLCSLYGVGQNDPNGACGGSVRDMFSADPVAAGNLSAYCRSSGNSPADEGNNAGRAGLICVKQSQITDATVKAQLADLCKKAENGCKVVSTTSSRRPSDTTRTETASEEPCTPNVDFVYSQIIGLVQQSSNPQESESARFPDAPAYCNAGYNGDRNDGSLMGANPAQSFMQAFAGGTGQ
ncbi:MAG: hypothetical protein ACJ76H_16615 [Bacteriovoracaceae bacterium]